MVWLLAQQILRENNSNCTTHHHRGLDLLYRKYNIIFHDIKSRKEIETLIFVRKLNDIAIGEICWESTGIKKIENLNAEKEHNT